MTRARLCVVLGIDGSGKSSVVEALAAGLNRDGLKAHTLWARWQPHLLQPIRYILRRMAMGRTKHVAGKEEPDDISALKGSAFGRWRWLGLVYLCLALLDYWWQYRRPLRAALGESDVVFLDRYWYDLVIDAVGNSAAGGTRAASLVKGPWRRWFPRPDVVILLDVSEEIARTRKGGENPLSYLRQRRELYTTVGTAIQAAVVDAGRKLDDVVTDVQWILRGVGAHR